MIKEINKFWLPFKDKLIEGGIPDDHLRVAELGFIAGFGVLAAILETKCKMLYNYADLKVNEELKRQEEENAT